MARINNSDRSWSYPRSPIHSNNKGNSFFLSEDEELSREQENFPPSNDFSSDISHNSYISSTKSFGTDCTYYSANESLPSKSIHKLQSEHKNLSPQINEFRPISLLNLVYHEEPQNFSYEDNACILQDVVDPEEKALLLELYPELTEEDNEIDDKLKSLSIIEISHDDFEEKNSEIQNISSCSDSFERYLNQLKNNDCNNTKGNNNKYSDCSSFLISDSESIQIYSDSEHEAEKNINDTALIRKVKPNVVDTLKTVFSSPPVNEKRLDADDHFLASLSADFSGVRHQMAQKFAKSGIKIKRMREELTDIIFEILKRRCFDNKIPLDRTNIVWNTRLLTTAGLCRQKVKQGTAVIELSLKVCTTPERLRDTLVHEMCHAATFLIDGQINAGHGHWWQRWTRRCMEKCPSLPFISVCHNYKIEKKYIYECLGCGQKIGRHSKSFKTEKFSCGRCDGKFVLTKNGKPLESAIALPNKFALFVKSNYKLYKKDGVKHHQVMKMLSEKWKQVSEEKTVAETVTNLDEVLDISVLSIHD